MYKRENLTANVGEKVDIQIDLSDSGDLSYAVVGFCLRKYSTDGEELMNVCLPIVDSKASLCLCCEKTKELGSGIFYYDVWLKDGVDAVKPIQYGMLRLVGLVSEGSCAC